MTLQFPIIQNVLFHIVTHLDFCHTMAASAAAVSGGNRREMALQTFYQRYDSTLRQSVLCQLSLLFSPGSPNTALDLSK
jgi:hypothetical protein